MEKLPKPPKQYTAVTSNGYGSTGLPPNQKLGNIRRIVSTGGISHTVSGVLNHKLRRSNNRIAMRIRALAAWHEREGK